MSSPATSENRDSAVASGPPAGLRSERWAAHVGPDTAAWRAYDDGGLDALDTLDTHTVATVVLAPALFAALVSAPTSWSTCARRPSASARRSATPAP